MFKDKKNIIILILSMIILVLIISFVLYFILNKYSGFNHIDGSNMSTPQLIEMFKSEGYELKVINIDGIMYTMLENEPEGITIQKIYNTLVGNLMTYDDDTINDKMADLLNTSSNDTLEEQQQYKAYENWLKKYNITKTQLVKMIDDYYIENKYNTEVINTQDLLRDY